MAAQGNLKPSQLERVQDLVARRTAGLSLEAPFYTDQDFFDADMKAIFARHWLFVAVDAEIPEAGDTTTVDFGPYSVIVLRDDDEEVRAFHNVCRHRGARLLDPGRAEVGNLVCPYHKWTYNLEGELMHAPSQAPDFDKSCFSLRSVHARSVAGLIFICLADEPPLDFDEVAATIEPYFLPHALKGAKVAHRTDLVENGNWKLVLENNRECYHCDGHPELIAAYFPVFGLDGDEDVPPNLRTTYERYRKALAEMHEIYDRLGLPYEHIREVDTRTTGFRVQRDALDGAGESYTSDGTAACTKTLGDLPEKRLGYLSMHMQPNSWFHVVGDHAVTFSALPISPDKTLVRTTWLVHPDAEEGPDYDIGSLTKIWTATNDQDAALVARGQQGVTNPAYVPGPYAPSEHQVEAFVNWYVNRLEEEIAR